MYFLRRSFTLVEIMIVVAVIILLSAIAIPNILRARLHTNETAAVATLRTLSNSLESFSGYDAVTGYPADLTALDPSGAAPPFVNPSLAVVPLNRSGYSFSYARDTVTVDGVGIQYHIYAAPITPNSTGERGFYIDEQGTLCSINPAAAADPGHAPLGRVCPAGFSPTPL